jgi:hypothetical protein
MDMIVCVYAAYKKLTPKLLIISELNRSHDDYDFIEMLEVLDVEDSDCIS